MGFNNLASRLVIPDGPALGRGMHGCQACPRKRRVEWIRARKPREDASCSRARAADIAVAIPSVRISASAHTLLMSGVSICHAFAACVSGSATGESPAAGPHRLAGATRASQSSPGQVTFGADKAKGGTCLSVTRSSPCCQAGYPLLAPAPKRQAASRACLMETRRRRDENPSCKVPFSCFNQNFNRNKE